jgi:hypothetical protein
MLPDDGMLLPKYVEASTQNKGVLQISAYCLSFLISLITHGMNIKLRIATVLSLPRRSLSASTYELKSR